MLRTIQHLTLCLLFATLGTLQTIAQTARQVMEQTATLLKKSGGLEANFLATTYKGTTPTGSTTGQIAVLGRRFRITTPDATTWYNGTTQWALATGSDEAYISTPTTAELQGLNPYAFIDLYKSGYNLALTTTTYHGRAAYEVTLTATTATANITHLLVTIDCQTHLPQCIRLKPAHAGWLRLQVTSLKTGRKYPAAYFEFDPSSHTNVKLIDLR